TPGEAGPEEGTAGADGDCRPHTPSARGPPVGFIRLTYLYCTAVQFPSEFDGSIHEPVKNLSQSPKAPAAGQADGVRRHPEPARPDRRRPALDDDAPERLPGRRVELALGESQGPISEVLAVLSLINRVGWVSPVGGQGLQPRPGGNRGMLAAGVAEL